MKYRTIGDFQRALEESLQKVASLSRMGALPPVFEPLLQLVPPEGMRPVVSVCYADSDRRIRGDAAGHKWHPEDCVVEIAYESIEDLSEDSGPPRGPREGAEPAQDADPMTVLIHVVDEAEQDPMLHFIAFKFLRDRLLPQTGYSWTRSFEFCQRLISDAIEQQVLITEKIANPRHPEFPVTGVRLNREHSSVREQVGAAPPQKVSGEAPAFADEGAPPAAMEEDRDLVEDPDEQV